MCLLKERLINCFKPLVGIVLWGWVNLPVKVRVPGGLVFTGGKSLGSTFIL